MFRHKFFLEYTCSWIVLIIVSISLDKIEILKNSIILKLIILSLFIAIILWLLNKQMPKINTKQIPKVKIVLIIIVFEVIYAILRGMIPDEIIPHTKITELLLRYLYSLIVISILLKTTKDDGYTNGEDTKE